MARFKGILSEIIWKLHHGLDDIGRAKEATFGQSDPEMVMEIDDGEVTIRTPEVAAKADADQAILGLMRFLALSTDRSPLVGQHILISWGKEMPFYPSPVPQGADWLRGTAITGTVTKADTIGIEVQPDGTEGFILSIYIDEILQALSLFLNLEDLVATDSHAPEPVPE